MTSKHGKMEFENKITFDSHQLCLNHLKTSDQNAYIGMQVFHLTAHCTENNEVKFAFQLYAGTYPYSSKPNTKSQKHGADKHVL